MFIPKNNSLTEAIIRYFHLYSLDAVPDQVLSLTRVKFWIPIDRSSVKKELKKCVRSIRLSAQPVTQVRDDLPSTRVNACRDIQLTRIDIASSINTKCQTEINYI